MAQTRKKTSSGKSTTTKKSTGSQKTGNKKAGSQKTGSKKTGSKKTAASKADRSAAATVKRSTSGKKTGGSSKSTVKTTSNTRKPTPTPRNERYVSDEQRRLHREIRFYFLSVFCVLLLLGNFGIVGKFGDYCSGIMFGTLGKLAYVFPLVPIAGGFYHILEKGNVDLRGKTAGIILFVINICVIFALFGDSANTEELSPLAYFAHCQEFKTGGGIIGGTLVIILKPFLGTVGTVILDIFLLLTSIILFFGTSPIEAVKENGFSPLRFLLGADLYQDYLDDDAYQGYPSSYREDFNDYEDYEDYEEEDDITDEEPYAYNLPVRRVPSKTTPKKKRSVVEQAPAPSDSVSLLAAAGGLKIDNSPAAPSGHKHIDAGNFLLTDIHEGMENLNPAQTETQKLTGIGALFDLSDSKSERTQRLPSDEMGEITIDTYPEDMDIRELSLPRDVDEDSFDNEYNDNDAFDKYEAEEEFIELPPPVTSRKRHTGKASGTVREAREVPAHHKKAPAPVKEPVHAAEPIYAPEPVHASEPAKNIEPVYRSSDLTREIILPSEVDIEVPAEPTGRRKTRMSQADFEQGIQDVTEQIESAVQEEESTYRLPYPGLLDKPKGSGTGTSRAELERTKAKLQETLNVFGVNADVTDYSCGPAVTRFEITPHPGVKVNRIVGLADDIKLSLAAADIRIEAPIPGKSAVGIEVPNAKGSMVSFRELIESEDFSSSGSKIAFAVGKDIGGKVKVTDIAKMPHLLIAGATGSGKSVCINTIIMSILYKAKPDEVKLIMIDPKVVELSVYNGIPHLLIPVVTDPKKAAGALNWAVQEMTDRYNKFANCGVRDIKGYNNKMARIQPSESGEKPEKMYQIVIIVDELADLMMVASKDVEESICRLAQLARACGIHLIIATQRPSVNVITGLIKANMPSRIAFAVTSGIDSRTILDMNGAEKLLGKGDMLFSPQGSPKPQRVQGAFVSDDEVVAVVEYITEQSPVSAGNAEVLKKVEALQSGGNTTVSIGGGHDSDGGGDPYFAEAGKIICDKEKASIGMLQRFLKVGFNRAARIMDQLEEAGVVGPEEGTKPRAVLMSSEEFENYLEQNG